MVLQQVEQVRRTPLISPIIGGIDDAADWVKLIADNIAWIMGDLGSVSGATPALISATPACYGAALASGPVGGPTVAPRVGPHGMPC